jgi:hypothetical protein
MITAEFAVGLVAVVPVLLALVALLGVGIQQVRLVEAARSGARMLARGDSVADVRTQVQTDLPGTEVAVRTEAHSVRVEVSRTVAGQGLLPGFTLRTQARAPREVPQ